MPKTNTTASWSSVKTKLRDFDGTALLGLLQDPCAAKMGAFVTKSRTAGRNERALTIPIYRPVRPRLFAGSLARSVSPGARSQRSES